MAALILTDYANQCIEKFARSSCSYNINDSDFRQAAAAITKEVGVRVAALAIVVLTPVLVVPVFSDLVCLNIRVLSEHGFFSLAIFKANFLFFKTIAIGCRLPLLAVIDPYFAYQKFKGRELMHSSIAELFVSFIPNFSSLIKALDGSREAAVYIASWEQEHPDWRAELASCLETNRGCWAPFWDFKFEIFRTAARTILLNGLDPEFVDDLIPSEPPSRIDLNQIIMNALPQGRGRELIAQLLSQPNLALPTYSRHYPEPLKKIHKFLAEALRCTRRTLIEDKVYSADDIEFMMGDSYEAMVKLAILKIIESTQKVEREQSKAQRICRIKFLLNNLNLELSATNNQDNYSNLCQDLSDIYIAYLKIKNNPKQMGLLREILSRKGRDASQINDADVKSISEKIGALFSGTIQRKILNTAGFDSQQGVPDFQAIFRGE